MFSWRFYVFGLSFHYRNLHIRFLSLEKSDWSPKKMQDLSFGMDYVVEFILVFIFKAYLGAFLMD